MTLVGTDATGRETVLPAAKLLHINAERDHYAVTLSVDEAVMQRVVEAASEALTEMDVSSAAPPEAALEERKKLAA